MTKYVVTTEYGYRKEFDTMQEAIEEANLIENSLLHPIAFIHKEVDESEEYDVGSNYDMDGYDYETSEPVRGCKDCPPDECTGHCMSCWYRPV